MSLLERRRAVALADLELEAARARWRSRTRAWREHYARHREAWLLGGGFGAGIAAGLLPLRTAASAWRWINGAAALALRSPIGAMLIEAATRRIDRRHGEADRADATTR